MRLSMTAAKSTHEMGRYRLRVVTFTLVFIGALIAALGPIADGDIYWHLAAGREILRRHALLRVDPFTLSAAGRPWVDVHWLFQIGVAVAHRVSGFVGLTVGKALIVAVSALISTRAAERAGGAPARSACAIAVVGLLFLARHLLPLRPVIVTLFFVAVYLDALEAYCSGRRRALLLLPVLQVVWVNCQGLAPLGPALIASYLTGHWLSGKIARRGGDASGSLPLGPLAVVLGLTILSSLATPYGIAAIALPGRLLARLAPDPANIFSAAVAENIPPFILERTAPEQTAHFRWILVSLGVALAAVRPRIRAAHALVLVGFVGLALIANRNVLLFYWVAAPLAAVALASRLTQWWSSVRWPPWLEAAVRGRLASVGLFMGLAVEIGVAGVALAREAPIGSPTPFHFPVESARRLATAGARGPIFAPDQHGGYLAFSVPGIRPYIDTRLMLHTAQEYADYLTLFDDPERFDALAAVQNFTYVVLVSSYPDRYLGLIAHLAASSGWRIAYTDGSEILFARAGQAIALGDRATVDAISAELGVRYEGRPELYATACLNLARTLIVVGQPGEADRVLSRLDSRGAAQLRARGHFAAGDPLAAEALTRILLSQDPRDVRSLTLMSEIAFNRELDPEGRQWLGRALAIDPFDPEARSVLAHVEGAGSGAPAARYAGSGPTHDVLSGRHEALPNASIVK